MSEIYSDTAKLIAAEVSSLEEVNFNKMNKDSLLKKGYFENFKHCSSFYAIDLLEIKNVKY